MSEKPTFVAVTKHSPVYNITSLNQNAPIGAKIGHEIEIVGWELVTSVSAEPKALEQ